VWGEEYAGIERDWCDLAFFYKAQGEYEQAELLYKRGLAIKENRTQESKDPDFFSNIGLFYKDWGKYEQAEPFLLRALATHEQAYAAEGTSMLDGVVKGLSALAELYEAQGRDDQAELLLQRALTLLVDKAERTDKEEAQYYTWGKYEQAEPLLKRVLGISERMWGPEHPKTAEALHNLAKHYYQHEKFRQAEPLLVRAIAIREQTLGPEHLETGKSVHNLGALYRAQGKYEQAEPLFRRSLKIYEQTLGPEHPSTLLELVYMAGIYWKLDEYAKAEPLYKRVSPFFDRLPGDSARRYYIWLLRELGQEQEAVILERNADSHGITASGDS